jgi:hypothetical protein
MKYQVEKRGCTILAGIYTGQVILKGKSLDKPYYYSLGCLVPTPQFITNLTFPCHDLQHMRIYKLLNEPHKGCTVVGNLHIGKIPLIENSVGRSFCASVIELVLFAAAKCARLRWGCHCRDWR